jgi:translation initiation factor 2-alpha kinase 4
VALLTVSTAVSPKRVHVGRSESGDVLVKVSCPSWYQSLLDINRSNKFLENDPPSLPDEWLPPLLQVNPLAVDKSLDIWDAGILFAQTLYGLEVASLYPTPAHLLADSEYHNRMRCLLRLILLDSQR